MDHTFVDVKSLKTLEDYAVLLASGVLSLMTLQNIHVKALKIGIMKEDQAERANTMLWDLRRLLNSYKIQLDSVLEILPDDFNHVAIIEKMKQAELKKIKSFTREANGKI